MIEIICPDCNKSRLIRREYYKSRSFKNGKSVCVECGRIRAGKKVSRIRKNGDNTIKVGRCRIIKKFGERCELKDFCKDYTKCLMAAAERNWEGFEILEGM